MYYILIYGIHRFVFISTSRDMSYGRIKEGLHMGEAAALENSRALKT
jgi:hypothetical protein